MAKQPDFPYNPSIQDIYRLMQSQEGKQLIAKLRENGGGELQKAMQKAETGDYEPAKHTLSKLLTSSDLQALMDMLGR